MGTQNKNHVRNGSTLLPRSSLELGRAPLMAAEGGTSSPPPPPEDNGTPEADTVVTAEADGGAVNTEFPPSKVKKIVKMDRDVKKVSSEALLLIRLASQLFLRSLAGKAAGAAAEKKRKTVNLDHLRSAVLRHPPTSCFLLDSLPLPQPRLAPPLPPAKPAGEQLQDPPVGTRRIDDFFLKQ